MKVICMALYTFVVVLKFKQIGSVNAVYGIASCVLAATGGGILVPLFINGLPVPLANDCYLIIMASNYMLLKYVPALGSVYQESHTLQFFGILGFETMRASVVTGLTLASSAAIPASYFSFPLLGPIICGTLGGCGGAFMPLSKGLEPLSSLTNPMKAAAAAAVGLHLYVNLVDSSDLNDERGGIAVALFFICISMVAFFNKVKKE